MKKNVIFSAIAVLSLWIVWLIAYACIRNDYILPSFWEVLRETGRQLGSTAFWIAFSGTLLRSLVAFFVSLLLGVACALLSELIGGVRAFLAPVVTVLRTLPTMAVILILLIWTSPLVAPALIALLVLFPAVYAAALAAFDGVEGRFSALANAYGVPYRVRIFRMYLPLSAKSLLTQSGAIASMGLKVTVSAEVLASTFRSLGGMMHEAQAFLNISTLFALTVLTVAIGFFLEGACWAIGKFAIRWRT